MFCYVNYKRIKVTTDIKDVNKIYFKLIQAIIIEMIGMKVLGILLINLLLKR